MAEITMVYDASSCSACKGCQVMCKQWNNLPSPTGPLQDQFTGSYQSMPDLNGETRLLMEYRESEGGPLGITWAFSRRSCFHCTDAACVEVCPTGALSYLPNGTVKLDVEKCIGCKYCTSACPFSVPKYREGFGYTNKCHFCFDRQAQGRQPACTQTCPAGALTWWNAEAGEDGVVRDREAALAFAKARVEELKGMGYDKAELYGENEMGGLHMLTIAKYGLEAHGLIRNPKKSAGTEALAWLKPLAGVGAAAVVGGLGLSFITGMGYKRDQMTLEDSLAIDSHGNPVAGKEE